MDSIQASVGTVPAFTVRVVAVLLVIPIDHVDRTVRAALEVNSDKFWVGAKGDIFLGMDGFVARAEATVNIVIDLMTTKVVREEMAAVFVGPVVTEIEHGPHV